MIVNEHSRIDIGTTSTALRLMAPHGCWPRATWLPHLFRNIHGDGAKWKSYSGLFQQVSSRQRCTPAIPANFIFFWRCAQVPWVPVAEVEYINNCSHLPSATGIEIAAGPQPAQITQVSSWDLLFRCGMIWTVGSACSCHWHRFYMPPGISWFIIL